MADFSIDFSVVNYADCTQLIFKDMSNYGGDYNSNPINYADVDSAILLITNWDGNSYSIDLTSAINAGNFTYTITGADFGGNSGDVIPDGAYNFYYHIVENENSYSGNKSQSFFMSCSLDCSIASKAFDVVDDCNCKENTLGIMSKILLYYKGMEAFFNCGNINKSKEIYEYISSLLNSSDCGCK